MIVLGTGLDPNADSGLRMPIIGYDNVVTAETVSALTAEEDHPAANLGNPLTSLTWRGVFDDPPVDEYVTVAIDNTPIDYLALARHNFGSASITASLELRDADRTLGSNLRTVGTAIGNMTGSGGLAAAYDNTTNQALAACSTLASATDAFNGRNFSAAPKRVFQAIVFGSNNQGYVNASNPSVTLRLMAKNGSSPANPADGTEIGILTPFTDTANESANPRTVISADQTTLWDYVWVRVTHDGAANTIAIAEVQIFEALESWSEVVAPILAADDEPLLFRFALQDGDPFPIDAVRLRLQPGTLPPEATTMYVGKLLQFPRGEVGDKTPAALARKQRVVNGQSERGGFIGRVITGAYINGEAVFQKLESDFFRESVTPFLKAAEGDPFFYAWHPVLYPDDVVFVQITEGKDPEPIYDLNHRVTLALDLTGISR